MLGRLLALFLIVPIVELALLIQLGAWIGFWPTILIIVLTGVTGSYLAKREGLSVWRRFNDRLQSGGLPGRELLDGVIILVAGALLITPGVLSDVVGLVGLIPLTRGYIRKYVNRKIQRALEKGSLKMSFGGFRYGNGVQEPEIGETGWEGRPSQTPRHGQD